MHATSVFSQEAGVSGEKSGSPYFLPETVRLGAALGLTSVQTIDGLVFSYGATGDYAVGTNLLVGGTLDYWSRASSAVEESRTQISDLAFGVNSRFVFTDVSVPFRPYALAGIAIHRFAVNVAAESGDRINKLKDVSQTAVGKLGIDIGGGVLYQVQKATDLAGEIRWRRLIDTTAELNQFAFTGGLVYAL